jgi:hypothetical protein
VSTRVAMTTYSTTPTDQQITASGANRMDRGAGSEAAATATVWVPTTHVNHVPLAPGLAGCSSRRTMRPIGMAYVNTTQAAPPTMKNADANPARPSADSRTDSTFQAATKVKK